MTRSLGVLLALCLAGLQFLAVLMVVFSSFLTSERALINHARDLLRDVGTNTIEHSKGFLNPARGAAELAARLAQNRVVASDDPQLLEQLLFQQLQIAPQFAGVYFGGNDGSFVYVMRDPEGPAPFRSKIILMENGERSVELIWRDNSFNVVQRQFDPADPYDPRTRPWFINASRDLSTIWTDPYIFFSSRQPGITIAAPVLGAGAEVKGAIGVDIEISMISSFLSRLRIGTNGKALIVHKNGDVIAHPQLDLIKTENADGTLRFANIREFEDPVARSAFAALADQGGFAVSQETASRFVHDGESYVSMVMPVISDLLPWTIAVYAPESDFTQVIKENRATNIWIAAFVAVLTGVVGLLLADYIHRPVRAFAVRSALIAQGEIDPATPEPRTYKELEKANSTLVQQIVARRDAEREYGQTFDLSSRGMAQIAPGVGRVLRANACFCSITGYTPADVTRMDFVQFLHPEEALPAPGERELDRAYPAERPLRFLRKDGETVWVALNAITVRDEAGHALHSVVTLDDVTLQQAQERQIVQLSRDLAHLARGNTMGQMAAGLAHELNQPLTAIAQNADSAILTVEQMPDHDPELLEILAEIERQSLRAGEIIRALRGFIRKDEGSRVAFDFAALLDQTLRLVQAEAVEAGVTITADFAALPPVLGNRVQVAQVIVNLLRNGIDAIAGQRTNEHRIIALRARLEGVQVRIEVEDTGPGVSGDINLFAQFETTKPEGMGLGLSICRSIVEANGGTLWHEVPEGGGARFCFTLQTGAGA